MCVIDVTSNNVILFINKAKDQSQESQVLNQCSCAQKQNKEKQNHAFSLFSTHLSTKRKKLKARE